MNGHTYEEIRAALLDLLAGRTDSIRAPDSYSALAGSIAHIFEKRGEVVRKVPGNPLRLTLPDEELVNEVFWNLFREGIITLGLDNSNPQFPHFRVSHLGKRILESHQTYFFHDVFTFEKVCWHQGRLRHASCGNPCRYPQLPQ